MHANPFGGTELLRVGPMGEGRNDRAGLLRAERRCYADVCDRLAREAPGKFVLIQGDRVVGLFDTEDAAIRSGFQAFGLAPFLVRQVGRGAEPLHLDPRECRP